MCRYTYKSTTRAHHGDVLIDPDTHTNPFNEYASFLFFLITMLAALNTRRKSDEEDLLLLDRIAGTALSALAPTAAFPFMHMMHSQMESFGITHIHHLYLPRAAQALGALWSKAEAVEDVRASPHAAILGGTSSMGDVRSQSLSPIQQGAQVAHRSIDN